MIEKRIEEVINAAVIDGMLYGRDKLTRSELEEHKKILMKNKEFREEYFKPNDIGMKVAYIRRTKGITQKELALMIGTKQSAISRFENGDEMVSLSFLHKVARALGQVISLDFMDEKLYKF